jgi:branched-chain amino acid transport system substrate-binding protein
MKFRKLSALAGASALLIAACTAAPGATSPATTGGAATGSAPASADTSKGTVKLAIELPLQGSELAGSQPVINGVKLAVKEHGGAAGGYKVEIPDSAIYDDALNGVHDPQTGAQNMSVIVGDSAIVGVVGPINSNVAKAQIPISNEAGLLQCSPANTNEGLTKPQFGALTVRKANPTKINYVRVATTDDLQGPAAAVYAYQKLGKKTAYVIDDTETFGAGIAKNWIAQFEKEGGKVVGHDAVPKTTTDYASILTAAKAKNPEVIYFGGVTASGGARILKAAVQAGLGEVPYIGPDGINDGSATTKDSFLNLVGDDAKNSYSTLAGIGDYPGKADFEAKYKAEYGQDATGYAAQGHACASVVLDALARAGATNPADMKSLREAVRAAGADTSHEYTSVLGTFKFDENGDTSQHIISIYSYDPATKNWVFKEQVDYGA